MTSITLKIVTPDGTVYDSEVDQVSLPTVNGEITILPNHVPLVSIIKAGEILVKKQGEEFPFAVSGGVIEVRGSNEVYVIADTAERAEHIDLERAEAARLRAEELMKEKHRMEDEEFALLAAKLEKELARVRVGKKYRNIS